MTLTIQATYEHGILKPKAPLTLPEGTEVKLTLDTGDDNYDPLEAVLGICDDGPDISLAERHDEFIYGMKPGTKVNP